MPARIEMHVKDSGGLPRMKRRYVTADVFTDDMFGGNPIAVVLDAEGLSTAQMQALAMEFNYSETTFVLPPHDAAHTARVRIFTPQTEVPFAGHPNVGTAFLLARNDPRLQKAATLSFEEAAGLVAAEIIRREGVVIGAIVAAPEIFRLDRELSAGPVALSLSLDPLLIRTDRHAPV